MADITCRQIPRTGQHLTTLGLGCAALGGLFEAVPAVQARAAVDTAWDAGVRLFDTAPFYGYTLSEHRVGEALREQPRDDFILSSKVGRLMEPLPPRAHAGAVRARGDAWVGALPFTPRFDYSAGALRRSVEDSLQRLGVCRLDIGLVHDIGQATHGDDNARHWRALVGGGFRELEQMRREGLIGAIGLGVNECAVVLGAMEHVALDCCLLAGRYTLLEQASSQLLLDIALEREMAVIVGGPFNSGVLVASEPSQGHFDYGRVPPDVLERVHRLARVCAAHDVPLPAAALQFPLAHPAVVAVVPGARSAAEFEQIAAWWRADLPASLWRDLRAEGLILPDVPVPT